MLKAGRSLMARTSAAGKRTCFLVSVLLLLAAVLMGYQYLFPAPKGRTAHVFVDGKEAASLPLNEDLEYRVSGADGGTNLLIVRDGQIWCQDADCPDKNCVRQGKKQLSTDTIICKPHKMAVTITGEE